MGVVAINSFRTEPGRLADHMAAASEALGHLRRLGLAAMNLQPLAGSDVGSIATVVNYADNASHAAGIQKVQGDGEWQEFWLRASSGGSATQVESAIYNDVDPDFQPATDRPLGVLTAVQWRAHDGRLMDFMGKVMEALPHIERMGGSPRVLQSMVGAHPMTTTVSVTFGDLDAYGAYSDTLARDQQWQDFWADALSDPTAYIVRSGVYAILNE